VSLVIAVSVSMGMLSDIDTDLFHIDLSVDKYCIHEIVCVCVCVCMNACVGICMYVCQKPFFNEI